MIYPTLFIIFLYSILLIEVCLICCVDQDKVNQHVNNNCLFQLVLLVNTEKAIPAKIARPDNTKTKRVVAVVSPALPGDISPTLGKRHVFNVPLDWYSHKRAQLTVHHVIKVITKDTKVKLYVMRVV